MSAITLPYLGKPGAMRVLPSPTGAVQATPSKGDVVHNLLSGGVSVTTRLNAKRTYSLPFEFLDATSADTLLGFYNRLYGLGPFAYVDPSVRNVLGARRVVDGAADQRRPRLGGLVRHPHAGGYRRPDRPGQRRAHLGVPGGVGDAAARDASEHRQPSPRRPAYLPTEACSVSLWAKASSATTASLQLTGYSAAGAVNYTGSATSMSLTTAWQQFTVSVAAGLAGLASSALVLPRVVLGGTVPTSVTIAAAQLEYGTAATAWQPGHGSPRVLPTTTPGRDWQQVPDISTNHTLVLQEVG
jgi:hypothetical protein